MRTTYPDTVADVDRPHPLLSANEHADFARNFREMEKYAKRPYSLMRVLRSFCSTPPKLDGFEMEVHQELMNLNRGRNVTGRLVPVEALSSWRRDLTIPGLPVVQITVADEILPFLRAKTVCGRLGATLLDGLTAGNLKIPRATVGATASWLPEVGEGTDTDQSLDAFTISPKRITGSTVVSRQLVYQSSPDIEAFVVNDLSNAIAVAVDSSFRAVAARFYRRPKIDRGGTEAVVVARNVYPESRLLIEDSGQNKPTYENYHPYHANKSYSKPHFDPLPTLLYAPLDTISTPCLSGPCDR